MMAQIDQFLSHKWKTLTKRSQVLASAFFSPICCGYLETKPKDRSCFPLLFSLSFKNTIILRFISSHWKGRFTERNRDRDKEKDLPSPGSLPTWSQCSWLSKLKPGTYNPFRSLTEDGRGPCI